MDQDSISSEIWLHAWINAGRPQTDDIPVSRQAIYGRCVDNYRSRERFTRYIERRVVPTASGESDDRLDYLRSIMSQANLSSHEVMLLTHRYAIGMNDAQVASTMNLTVDEVNKQVYSLITRLQELERRSRKT